jgi:hypothetical protein
MRHPRRLLAALLVFGPLLAGCSPDSLGIGPDGGAVSTTLAPAAAASSLNARPQEGHPWFPLTPGRYADFRIRRLTVDEPTYVRATMGEPESFFGRLATPWVFGEVPGLPVDETLFGLRQYFSIAPDGALWFHGAQNNGFMSYTEPPVRMLPRVVQLGESVIDTVLFESFLPGNIPFYRARQSFQWSIVAIEWLDLPAGSYRSARAQVLIDDVDDTALGKAGPRIAAAALFGAGLAAAIEARDGGLEAVIVERARRESIARGPGEEPLVPERGMWFARHTGMVARDYPHGQGVDVINITTYERTGEGFGPLPAPQPAP